MNTGSHQNSWYNQLYTLHAPIYPVSSVTHICVFPPAVSELDHGNAEAVIITQQPGNSDIQIWKEYIHSVCSFFSPLFHTFSTQFHIMWATDWYHSWNVKIYNSAIDRVPCFHCAERGSVRSERDPSWDEAGWDKAWRCAMFVYVWLSSRSISVVVISNFPTWTSFHKSNKLPAMKPLWTVQTTVEMSEWTLHCVISAHLKRLNVFCHLPRQKCVKARLLLRRCVSAWIERKMWIY